MISVLKGSHKVPSTKSKLFTGGKDEWDAKEDTGKFMKNALYIWKKGPLGPSHRKIKPIA